MPRRQPEQTRQPAQPRRPAQPTRQTCLVLTPDLHEAMARARTRDITVSRADIIRRGLARELDRLESANGGPFPEIPDGWSIPAGGGDGQPDDGKRKRQFVTRLPEDLVDRVRCAVFANPGLRISTMAEAGAWVEIEEGLARPRRRERQIEQKGLLGRLLDGVRGG